MGYPQFGNVKTVVIPVPKEDMSVQEYKNAYGIDLRDIVLLDKGLGNLYLKPNTFYLVNFNTAVGSSLITNESYLTSGMIAISKVESQSYESGVKNAQLLIKTPDEGYFLEIGVDKSLEFSYENMYIRFNEI